MRLAPGCTDLFPEKQRQEKQPITSKTESLPGNGINARQCAAYGLHLKTELLLTHSTTIFELNVMKPKLFIGSSSEGLEIARAIELNLERDAEVTIWSNGLFGLGLGTLETLVNSLNKFDFAALVLTPDDILTSRGATSETPRDNVLLELGLFIGYLGRQRTFIVYNRDKNLKLPSDLAGVTPADYGDREDSNIQAALSPTCTKIRYAIKSLGTFARTHPSVDRANSISVLRPIVTARVTTHSAGNVVEATKRTLKPLDHRPLKFQGF